jgi:hypothetical protein
MTFCIILVIILFFIILWGGMTRWKFVKERVKESFEDKGILPVTLLVRSYDRPHYLSQTINSMLQSDIGRCKDRIIYDDGSKNQETLAILQNIAREGGEKKFKVQYNTTNVGCYQSYPAALDFIQSLQSYDANGYTCIIDNDVVVKSTFISQLFDVFQDAARKLNSRNIVLSGFNPDNAHNKSAVIQQFKTFHVKRSVGAVCYLFSNHMIELIRSAWRKKEDWGVNDILFKLPNHFLCCVNSSLVNHVGEIGLHSSRGRFDSDSKFKQHMSVTKTALHKPLYQNRVHNSLDDLTNEHGVLKAVFVCWFGVGRENPPMPLKRQKAFASLVNTMDAPVVLVTSENLSRFEVAAYPIHPAFWFLSGNHKSDYLRAYLLHHYGGGYHDIKHRKRGWGDAWSHFKNRNVWIVSRAEKKPGHIGYPVNDVETWRDLLQTSYKELGTMGWVICRKNTPYTRELINHIHSVLDKNMEKLKRFPSPEPRCCYRDKPFNFAPPDSYPLRWLELMGEKFHPLMYKFKTHMVFDERIDADTTKQYA